MKHQYVWTGNLKDKTGYAKLCHLGKTVVFNMNSIEEFNELTRLVDEIVEEAFRTGRQALADTVIATVQKSLL